MTQTTLRVWCVALLLILAGLPAASYACAAPQNPMVQQAVPAEEELATCLMKAKSEEDRKTNLSQQPMLTNAVEVSALSIRRLKIDGEAAQDHASLESAVEARTGKLALGFGGQHRSFQFVKEAGTWKSRQKEASEAELTAMLIAAKNEKERAALLAANKELLTVQLCDSLARQGRSYVEQSNYPAALVAFQLSRTVAEGISNTKGVIAALTGTGNVYQARGDLPAALDTYQQAQKLAEVSGERAPLAGLQSNLCSIQQRLGNYDLATEHCQRSLALAEPAGNKVVAANALNSLGIIARQRGNYELALESYRKSLALFEELEDKRSIARLLNNLGVAYNAMGNVTAALQQYLRSLPIAEEIGNKAGVAGTLSNVSMIYRTLGNYDLALEYSQRSFAVSEALGDKTTLSSALEEIGKIHAQAGEYPQALDCYVKSLALAEQTGEKLEVAIRLLSVGNGYRNLGNDRTAIEYYQRGLLLAESIGAPYTAIACRFKLSELYLRQGRNAEALEVAERAVAQARQTGAHKDFWQALLIAGLSFRALNQPEQARKRFEEAISVIEMSRSELTAGEREQAFFFEARFDPYIQMVTLLAEQGKTAEAFTFAERAKARVLLDVLQAGRVDISKAMTEREREQENRLRTELNSLNVQLRRESQAVRGEPLRLEELKAKLGKARLAYEGFQTQLYAAHTELRIQRGEAPPLKPQDLAAMVPDPHTALLEYAVTDEKTNLFVLTRETNKPAAELKVYTIPIKRKDLAIQVESFREKVGSRNLLIREPARQAYDLLLKPAQELLQNKTHLIIVPDDVLWELPFQALLTESNRYLIEQSAISYAPSLTVLREMMAKRQARPAMVGSNTSLLALGNPSLGQQTIERARSTPRDERLESLPETEREVKTLARLYGPAQSEVFIGAEAREDRAKTEAGKFRVLHFATHGVVNNASPMYSYLVLSQGDSKEDGLLEAWELLKMDLKAEMVVLSACETARGRVGAGEGMIGLSWALFVAGTPTAVVSQWKVDSASTTELMLEFHRNRLAANSKAQSLRKAMLKLLGSKDYKHPFYWAPFVVIGAAN
jgi:CHAT domain-containing protein/tetratricopeptide (TPR) repeat protein